MSERKLPSAKFWCGASVFGALLAYRIDLIGWFIVGLIEAFGDWAWVTFLALWICAMIGTAIFVVLRRRDGTK